ncbi:hypothetical protein [Trabulsiella guamensis]|uniref:hypothetical protein n=1 Tax=Trabulsiella guamensis TaxID=158852 RepID=UPI00056DC69F|nr:hypothetical protein [Trabulsiella guamensis]
MTDKERVLFLFAQTCAIIGRGPTVATSEALSRLAEARARLMGPYAQLNDDFDSVYSILEQKLKEKLPD